MKFLKRKKRLETEELDITSLLDILIILLVFLLQNMSNAELNVDNLDKNLKLPFSKSMDLAKDGLTAQVNRLKQVFIESDRIGNNLDDIDTSRLLTHRLKELRFDPKSKQFEDIKYLNILVDRELEYRYVEKLMAAAVEAGFEKFKLVVQGKE